MVKKFKPFLFAFSLSALCSVGLFAQPEPGDVDPAECQALFEQALAECLNSLIDPNIDADGVPGDDCFFQADQAFLECIGEPVDPIDPPPPPPFPIPVPPECEDVFNQAMEGCISADGTVDPECSEKAQAVLNECIADIDLPPDAECFTKCESNLQFALLLCDQGTPDFPPDACFERVHLQFEDCINSCEGTIDPDPNPNPSNCEGNFFAAVQACTQDDGTVSSECIEQAEENLRECMKETGLEDDVICTFTCDLVFNAEFINCLTGGFDPAIGADVGPDPDCFERLHRSLEDCMFSCEPDIPEELKCVSSCDATLWDSLSKCEDEECIESTYETYWACVKECGVEVPEIPEVDFCFSKCDIDYQKAIQACFETGAGPGPDGNFPGGVNVDADGFFDQECFIRADEDFVRCISSCEGDVLPDLPPIPADPCITACEATFNETLESCLSREGIDPALGGPGGVPGDVDADGNVIFDDDCFVKADEAFLACITDCGVEVPEPPELPPGEECNQTCAETVFVEFESCVSLETGIVDDACVETLEQKLMECLNSCTDGEEADDQETRALVAQLRSLTQVPNFIRGDANQDNVTDITDPIVILAYLFLGGTPIQCADAADANDDGVVDVSDPVAVLAFMFLGDGPLPAPSGPTPGADPTVDNLGCDNPATTS